jgi:glycosyltransferase involved in cell wall biosynthesis
MDLVSVIIPLYNYGAYVEETLASVAFQQHKEVECIIIDDGSTDDSRQRVESFCLKDNRFKYYYQNNQGLAAARNAGLLRATGQYIAFLDADDLWAPSKLVNQLAMLKAAGRHVVFSRCDGFTNSGETVAMGSTIKAKEYTVYDFIDVDVVTGSSSSVMLKAEVYQKVGLFDINLRSLEDFDYWFRCAFHGFEFVYSDSLDVHIRVHQASMSNNYLKMYQYHFIVLEKQLGVLDAQGMLQNRASYRAQLLNRLGRIRWYATEGRRYDLCLSIHLFGYGRLGFSYFNRLNVINFLKDSVRFLMSRRNGRG